MKTHESGATLLPEQNGSDKSEATAETLVIGGKAMAKLVDVIADLYCTGPNRKLDALGVVALAIERAGMQVKCESDGHILYFDDEDDLSEVTQWLQETNGVYRIVFRDGYVCKYDVANEAEAVLT
jgi:hypothetical protein